jgi:hypothetical protein
MERAEYFNNEIEELLNSSDRVKAFLFDEIAHEVGGEPCAICQNILTVGDQVLVLFCNHAFHVHCLKPWVARQRKSCPSCRQPFLKNTAGTFEFMESITDSQIGSQETDPDYLSTENQLVEEQFSSGEESAGMDVEQNDPHGNIQRHRPGYQWRPGKYIRSSLATPVYTYWLKSVTGSIQIRTGSKNEILPQPVFF